MDEKPIQGAGGEGQDANGGGNAGKAEKLFTQEEVNRIVSDRLAREREKPAQQPAEASSLTEREKALEEREKAIAAREFRAECENLLKERGIAEKHRAALLELGISDKETFEKILNAFGDSLKTVTVTRGAEVPHPPQNRAASNNDEEIRAAFRPSQNNFL